MRPRRRQRKSASAMRLVGRQLARFREVAGLTQRELANAFNLTQETVASIEQGRRPLKPDLAERFDGRLDTKGALSVAVEHLPEVHLIPAWAEEYMDLEREAVALSWYDNQVVPGLLQTKRYARGVFPSRVPAFNADESEAQVAARVARQEILARTRPPTISFVMWEAILMTA
jgi:transcriptional regulator with XRE-family HTH domain